MKVFNGIIGVLAIFCALYCIFWPTVTFLNVGWIVALVLFFWGICAIITYAADRKRGDKVADNAQSGVLGLVFGIIAIVVSIIAMFSRPFEALLTMIILILFIVFLFLVGIKNIVHAIKKKKSEDTSGWVAMLILGIIQIILGLFGASNWLFSSAMIGIFIGIMLGVFGITLIAQAFTPDDVDRYKDF